MRKIFKIALGIIAVAFSASSFAQTYTFTNCAATGRFGPTQGMVNTAYTGPNTLAGNVTIITQGIQEWTVPATGAYRINVTGAKGGNSTWGTLRLGGNGTNMQGDFNLVAGQVVRILVGQTGETDAVGGGGGGTYVSISGTAQIVAGGGGGASSDQNALAAVVAQNGTQDSQNLIAGGTAGSGGLACTSNQNMGGGGGGFSGDGMDATNGTNYGRGGLSFLNGGVGGIDGRMDNACNDDAEGGFGGGGSTTCRTVGGGGGGGYSGGAGGPHVGGCGASLRAGGGGGGSFNSGTNQANTAGVGTGMGTVIITSLCAPVGAPALTCPSNITQNNDAGQCDAVVTYTAPVGTDNCGNVTTVLTSGPASGGTFPVGVTTVTYTATNANGSTPCSFTVTVVDAEAPALSCPANITVNNDAGQCDAVVTYTAPVGTDNCTGVTTAFTSGLASGATFPVGVTTVTYTATDAASNATPCSFTVTVVDAEAPTITCPANVTVNNDAGQCDAVVTYTLPVGADNCTGVTVALTSGLASGATFPVGVSTVTYTATDAASNTSSPCSFTVTVVDAEAPTITCPANITQNNDAGQCDAVVTYTLPVGADNCTGVTVALTSGLASGATFPVGVSTVTYTATDAASNTSSPCSFTVTVVDAEAPVLACPANITMSNDSGMCDAVVTYTAPVGTDNCTGVTTALTSGPASGATFPVGVTTVTYTATDAASNATPCSFTVTVVDTTSPMVTCPADVASCDTIVNGIAPVSTSDNCVGEYVTYTLTGATTGSGATDASGTNFSIGTTVVTYLVTDTAGNNTSCTFNVVVNPLPTVALTAFSPDTVCVQDVAMALPVGTPGSGTYSGAGVVGTTFDPATAGIGTHYVVYTFTDANSCSAMDSTMIVVEACVGINENGSLAGVSIYPNPTNGLVNINLGNHNGSVNYTISTIEGRMVTQEQNVTTNKMTINLNNESKGIYLLRIEDTTSSKVYKIIKE